MSEMTPSEVFIQRIKCQNYKVCDELLAEHDKKIIADAIDECIGAVNSEYIENINLVPYRLVKRLEQLKEKAE